MVDMLLYRSFLLLILSAAAVLALPPRPTTEEDLQCSGDNRWRPSKACVKKAPLKGYDVREHLCSLCVGTCIHDLVSCNSFSPSRDL